MPCRIRHRTAVPLAEWYLDGTPPPARGGGPYLHPTLAQHELPALTTNRHLGCLSVSNNARPMAHLSSETMVLSRFWIHCKIFQTGGLLCEMHIASKRYQSASKPCSVSHQRWIAIGMSMPRAAGLRPPGPSLPCVGAERRTTRASPDRCRPMPFQLARMLACSVECPLGHIIIRVPTCCRGSV